VRVSLAAIVANPASGKDIRRLVAHGSVFDNQEKVRMVRRLLLGLERAGVERVLYMPEGYGIVPRALNAIRPDMAVDALEMPVRNNQDDSVRAAEIMETLGADVVIVLGGDGTSRAVCKGLTRVPVLPLSTGTNNVFPFMLEASVAGLAAGLVAAAARTPSASRPSAGSWRRSGPRSPAVWSWTWAQTGKRWSRPSLPDCSRRSGSCAAGPWSPGVFIPSDTRRASSPWTANARSRCGAGARRPSACPWTGRWWWMCPGSWKRPGGADFSCAETSSGREEPADQGDDHE
jgi:hypothetical protein